ncbi:hypothetical protein ACFX2J_013474 [Malus domestica]
MERAAFAAGQKKERKKYKKIKGVVRRTGGGCLYSRVRTGGDKGEQEKSVGGSWSGRRELPFGQLAQTQERRERCLWQRESSVRHGELEGGQVRDLLGAEIAQKPSLNLSVKSFQTYVLLLV